MNSTLTLYFKCLLHKEKNFILDNNKTKGVELYLSTLQSETITGFQYIKHKLALFIKIKRNQLGLMMGQNAQDLNYIKIQNGSEVPMYYFIVDKKWISEDTIELSLNMDTLNSFIYNNDYIVNKKSLINREHEDRLAYYERYVYITRAERTTAPISPGATKTYLIDYYLSSPIMGVSQYNNKHTVKPNTNITYNGKVGTQYSYTVEYLSAIPRNVVINFYDKKKIFRRKVDLYSEGINAPLYKEKESNIIDKNINDTWYLLYRNTQQQDATDYINTSPVECFLCADNPLKIKYADEDDNENMLTTSNLDDGYTSILPEYGISTFEVAGVTYTSSYHYQAPSFWNYAYKEWYFPYIYRTNSDLTFKWVQYRVILNDDGSVRSSFMNIIESITTQNVKVFGKPVYGFLSVAEPDYEWATTYTNLIPNYNQTINMSYTGEANNGPVSSIDRTDSRNIKLLALPYCPVKFTINSQDALEFDNSWTFDTLANMLKYKDLSVPFNNILDYDVDFSPFDEIFIDELLSNTLLNQNRNDKYESKLYHSDFYRPKFVYDSFSYNFQLELYDYSTYPYYDNLYISWGIPIPEITFIQTTTINSKFLFKFDTKYLIRSTEDYDGIVCVSRNNEEVLYNSAYINYVRAGYNYDKKTLERNKLAGAVGIGLSGSSALLSIAGGLATGNYAMAGLGLATTGIGLAGQITNLIRNTAQSEQSIQQKLDETSRQAVSVSGSDDIDLLKAYSDNKAKFVLYHMSSRMEKVVGDLFYYCGYKRDIQDIPNMYSRYWFNFAQADLVIDDTENLSDEIVEDIKEKFRNGVTMFHYHSGYNLAQTKENWEISLVPYLGGN